MNEIERLVNNFEKELKYWVQLKTGSNGTPEKVLLESFKYFDISGTGDIDYKIFEKVIKIWLGISLFNDEELYTIYDYFANNNGQILYWDLISKLYDS